MDDCIVALERDLGHDPEAFRLAVEMLRRETWGSTDDSVPRHEPILLGEPTPSAATHPTTTKSSSLGRSGPQALNRSFATPSRSRSPASIPAASRATAANKASSDRSARVLSALTTAASNIPSTSRHYAPTIDVTQLLVPPNALQTSVVQMFVTGRSMIALCGRRSGRAVLTTMLAQLASLRLDGFSFTSARTAIVCGESCFDRLVAGPLGFMSRNGEVLLDSAARLESTPWTVEDLAGVGVLIVMGNVPELSPNVLDGVLARLQTTPQTVVLIDAYSPELFTRDNELADAVTWAVGHPSGAANVPLALTEEFIAEGKGTRAVAVHPGVIPTGLATHLSEQELGMFAWKTADGSINPHFKTVEQGAATSVWACTSPELNGVGGVYLENCSVTPKDQISNGVPTWAAPDAKLVSGTKPHVWKLDDCRTVTSELRQHLASKRQL